MRDQKRGDSLFGSDHDALPEGANQVRSGAHCWKMWRSIPSGLSASNLAFQIEPIAIHIQATHRGARSPHSPSQSRIFLPQQVRIDKPSRHGLIAEPRPAFEEGRNALGSTSPGEDLHFLIQPAHDSLDTLPRCTDEPSDSVVGRSHSDVNQGREFQVREVARRRLLEPRSALPLHAGVSGG